MDLRLMKLYTFLDIRVLLIVFQIFMDIVENDVLLNL